MKVSTKGRYAIRLMLDVAENSGDGNVAIKDIAKRQEISIKYLEQIVNMLCKGGMLKSQRGAQGGYRLTRQPSEYTIGEILRVTEGSIAPIDCLENEINECPRAAICKTIKFWQGLYDKVNEYLDGITLEDLISDNQDGGFNYCI